eukprot:IDg23445t1
MDASNEILKRNCACGGLLEDVFGVMDRGSMPCSDYIDIDTQNYYYEGYTQNVEVTNLKLCDEKTPAGHCILGDSAFAASARVTNG